ncbi:hypothetical protein EDB89DRAFT_1913143 [Lactarius sanguifluus]|nr:hypothetical protein EDB89DRAFT_1913143 [Lactarius sanguifluus]
MNSFQTSLGSLGTDSPWTTYVLLGTVVLGDILVAVSMCRYLYHKRTGFLTFMHRADSVLIFLMAYSINSGLLTGLLGVATTITFIVSPSSLIWLGCSWAMSKCYVNSLLGRLNIREYLRDRSTPGELDNAHNLSFIRAGGEAGIFVSIEDSTANVPPQRKPQSPSQVQFKLAFNAVHRRMAMTSKTAKLSAKQECIQNTLMANIEPQCFEIRQKVSEFLKGTFIPYLASYFYYFMTALSVQRSAPVRIPVKKKER